MAIEHFNQISLVVRISSVAKTIKNVDDLLVSVPETSKLYKTLFDASVQMEIYQSKLRNLHAEFKAKKLKHEN